MSNGEGKDPRDDDRYLDLQTLLEETYDNLVLQLSRNGCDQSTAIEIASKRIDASCREAWSPSFDDAGYLPPELECTEQELVHWFGSNNVRIELLNRIREWIKLGKELGAKSLLIDGSFITAKKSPGDVDAVIFLPNDFIDKLDNNDPSAVRLSEMLATRQPKELFAAEDETSWWQWFAFFSQTREASGQFKRLIRIKLRQESD